MKYLECLMMIRYLLSKLESESRKQVPVDCLHELRANVMDMSTKLMDAPTTKILMKLRSLQEALAVIKVTPGTMFLTDRMKSILVDGFKSLREEIHLATFEYFKYNDFEPTEVIIDLMREVVETAAKKGVV